MKPYFLFPASPMDGRMIDEAFQDQAIALKMAGFSTSLLTDDMKIIGDLSTAPEDAVVVYRGWMMDTEGYQHYLERLHARPLKEFTTLEQYLTAHHIPNWHARIASLTPETLIFPGRDMLAWETVVPPDWTKIQVKDYVKSLKTGSGSVITSTTELEAVLGEMEFYRGTLEGGIVIRRYEEFRPDSETRYFVINKRFYGQEPSFDTRVMALLMRVARDIPSPFFSVDIAERIDGQHRVVEIGDGQVSDLVGWTPERFAEIWK